MHDSRFRTPLVGVLAGGGRKRQTVDRADVRSMVRSARPIGRCRRATVLLRVRAPAEGSGVQRCAATSKHAWLCVHLRALGANGIPPSRCFTQHSAWRAADTSERPRGRAAWSLGLLTVCAFPLSALPAAPAPLLVAPLEQVAGRCLCLGRCPLATPLGGDGGALLGRHGVVAAGERDARSRSATLDRLTEPSRASLWPCAR